MFTDNQSKNAVGRRRIVLSTSLTRRLIGRISEIVERFHPWSTVSILFVAAIQNSSEYRCLLSSSELGIASAMHCEAAVGPKDIVSQRVMGPVDAERAANHVEKFLYDRERLRHRSSQVRGLFKCYGVIESPQLSAHPAPLSASKYIISLDPSLNFKRYTQSNFMHQSKFVKQIWCLR